MNLFDDISNSDNADNSIFADEKYLEKHYLPPRLIGRDNQLITITDAYRPIFKNEKPHNLFLFGKSGTGKNVAVEYVLYQLKKKIEELKSDIELVHLYISCDVTDKSATLLRKLIQQAKSDPKLPNAGFGAHEYFDKFLKIFENESKQLIVIELDKIRYLKNYEALSLLSKANDRLPENTMLGIIGISDNSDFELSIDPNLASSLNFKYVEEFKQYNKDELYDILNDRRPAFSTTAIDDNVISYCSELSAEKHGDAYRTIKLLQDAGFVAKMLGHSKITILDVLEAFNRGKPNQHVTMDSLSVMQKAVLLAVVEQYLSMRRKHENKPIRSGGVFSQFKNVSNRYHLNGGLFTEQDVIALLHGLQSSSLLYVQKDKARKNAYIVELKEDLIADYRILDLETKLEKSIFEYASESHE